MHIIKNQVLKLHAFDLNRVLEMDPSFLEVYLIYLFSICIFPSVLSYCLAVLNRSPVEDRPPNADAIVTASLFFGGSGQLNVEEYREPLTANDHTKYRAPA